MTIQVFGADATVSYLNRAFTDTSPANAIYSNQVANAKSMGDTPFANAFAASWAGTSNADLSKLVLTNMGVLPTTDKSVAALEQALTDYFAAFGAKTTGTNGQVTADTRGLIVLQLSNIISQLETNTGSLAVYNKAAVAWNSEVAASYTYSSNTANTTPSTGVSGQTFTLTTGNDTFTGGAADDVFNATGTGTANPWTSTFTAFDTLDGGAGNDTLNINDSSTGGSTFNTLFGLASGGFAANSIKNIETLNVTTNSQLSAVNIKSITDLTKATFSTSAATATDITAAKTTDVIVNQLGTAAVTVTGGKTVVVNGGNAATVAEAAADAGTLTAVTLTKVDGTATVTGTALTSLTVGGATVNAHTYTVANSTASHALTINAAGTGYQADGTTASLTTVVDAVATSVTINTTAKSNLDLAGSTLVKTVTLTGSGDLALAAVPAAVTTIDGSAATGGITTTATAATTSIKTGAGADSVTISSFAAGSTLSLGAGNDKALGSFSVVPGTIDGGDGVDTVSTALISTANLSKFVNFEKLDLTAGNASFDVSSMPTSDVIAGLSITGTNAASTLTNVPATAGLSVAGANTALVTIGVKGATAGTTDAYTVSFDSTSTTAATHSANVALNGIENVTVASGGDKSTGNTLTLADDALQTVTITGAKDFTLTMGAVGAAADATNGLGVKLIDGSAATGKLTIDASTGLVTANIAKAALTIKGGTGADTIKGSALSDYIIGGGGADVITGGAGSDKITISGNTSTIQMLTSGDTGSNVATNTQTALLTSALDIVTGATAGTKITLDTTTGAAAANKYSVVASAVAAADSTLVAPTTTLASNLQGANNAVVFARGTYDAANGIFNYGAAGTDTAMTYDYDGAAATMDYHTIILVGYVPSATTAATAAGSAGNIATITLA